MLSAIARFDAVTSPRRRPSQRRLSSSISNLNYNSDAGRNNTNNNGEPSINLLVLELHRLLHCMERTEEIISTKITWQALGMRMELLQSLWQQIQHAVVMQQEEEEEEPPEWYRNYEQRVYRASQKAQEGIHALQRQETADDAAAEEEEALLMGGGEENQPNSSKMASATALIDQIFFPQEEQHQEAAVEEDEEEEQAPVEQDLIGQPMPGDTYPYEEKEPSQQQQRSNSNYAGRNSNNNNVDIQAFQKEQREQIEQAIAQMAAQMKTETERIHTTLKGQNEGVLGEVETIVGQNVQDVTKVTEDVRGHVKAGWKRSFGTITLLIMVTSLFLFSLVTIYMIPKYNSPPSAVPPQKLCRMINGKEECLDLNAWLTGSSSSPLPSKEEEEASAPYFATQESPPANKQKQKECTVGMDGRCITQEKFASSEPQQEEEHHKSEAILKTQMAVEAMLNQEKQAKQPPPPQKQREPDTEKELSEEVLALLNIDLEAEGLNVDDLSEDDIAMLKLELEAEGKLEENREQKLAKGREWRRQQEEAKSKEAEEKQHHSASESTTAFQQEEDEPLEPFVENEGESEFDLARRREQLLKEREQRENLHIARQRQQQGQASGDHNELLDERERMKREYEEQLKHRDEFRERELRQLEAQRLKREEEERRKAEQEDRQRQEASEREQKQQEQKKEEEFMDLPPPPPSESFAEQAKGFEAFRDEQKPIRPKAKKQPGVGGGAAMGFGAGLGGGGAAAEVDPFGGQKKASVDGSGTAEQPLEPEFKGKPFAPRDIRRAAASGENDALQDYLEQRPHWVNKLDKNNWGAIHLAVRAGHSELVEILVNANADVNGRTVQGLTPLGMALERLGEEHPVTNLLRQHGGEL